MLQGEHTTSSPPSVRGSCKVVFKKTNRFLETQNFVRFVKGAGKDVPDTRETVKRGAKVP